MDNDKPDTISRYAGKLSPEHYQSVLGTARAEKALDDMVKGSAPTIRDRVEMEIKRRRMISTETDREVTELRDLYSQLTPEVEAMLRVVYLAERLRWYGILPQ